MKYDFFSKQFIETTKEQDKIAISGSDYTLSWKELKEKVEHLTQLFKNQNIPQGHPVIIYGHKEALFPAAMLACIHAGITYTPIDKIYPQDRIKKIVDTTGSQVLINCCDDVLQLEFPIIIDNKLHVSNLKTPQFTGNIYCPDNDILQYIMFTSGSTGEPKGVQITYSSILSFITWAHQTFGFTENDVFMNQAPFTFDVSLCDLLNAFSNGGSLVLTSTDMVKDQESFIERLKKLQCTVWTSTPSFAFLFLRHPSFKGNTIPSLKTFFFMGEELPNRTCSILKTNFNSARVLNAYGPTEATIVTTFVDITEDVIKKYPSLPIGYPMTTSTLLIENQENDNSKEGELIIVGDHVSIGYFKNEALNKQKFFIHKGKRAFKTGDLAYYKDGMVFYLGRNDDQVKLHGYRIELNEISNVICKHPLIADAVTVPLKRGNEVKKLISFVTLKNAAEQKNIKTTLTDFLATSLPYYMIPGDVVTLNKFPHSTSHKIDKNKLIEDYLKLQIG